MVKGYKQTDIGVIPEDWDIKQIKDFTDGTAGGTPSTHMKNYWGGSIKWMNSGELNNKIIYDVEGRITEEGLQNSSTKLLPENCILIGLAGQGKTRGTVAINKVSLCTNQSIAAIYPNDKYISNYLFYNLENRYNELRAMSTGDGGRGGLNLTILRNIEIAFPGLEEQKSIAQALSDTDDLIVSLEKLIAKKEAIKQGTMQQLLTGKKRLAGFSEEWEEKKLGEFGVFSKGSGIKKDESNSGDIPCIRYGEIYTYHNEYIKQFKSYISKGVAKNAKQIKQGDLLFAGSGETKEDIGKCVAYVNDFDAYAGGDIVIFSPKNVDSLFLGFLLNIPLVAKQKANKGQGDAVVHISANSLSEVQIKMPINKNEQQAIAKILSDMDDEIEMLKSKLSKTKAIKEAMMSELLTGKTRLTQGI